MILQTKEVDFAEYCCKCKYSDLAEDSYPCDECLEYPCNEHSHKPVRFRAKDETVSASKGSS